MKNESAIPDAKKFFLLPIFFLILGAIPTRGQTVNLSWQASSAPSPTYNVYRSERISGTGDSFSLVSSGISILTFSDSAVKYGHVYAYYVTTVSGGTEGTAKSNVILVYVTRSAVRPAATSTGQVTGPGRMSAKR
jgi:fibronectin type 3 domain-containing protein